VTQVRFERRVVQAVRERNAILVMERGAEQAGPLGILKGQKYDMFRVALGVWQSHLQRVEFRDYALSGLEQ